MNDRPQVLTDPQRHHEGNRNPGQRFGQHVTAETVADQHPRHHRNSAGANALNQSQHQERFKRLGQWKRQIARSIDTECGEQHGFSTNALAQAAPEQHRQRHADQIHRQPP
ncbi:hypothetical protein D3C84_899170 [compost metagenome]